MVSADNFSDGSVEIRPALADTTNRLQKRLFSMISGDSPLKSGDGFRKEVANDGDLHFAKQFCFGLENSKSKSKLDVDRDDKVLSFRKDKQPCVQKSFGGGAVSSLLPDSVSSDDDSGLPSDPTEKYLDRSFRVTKGNTRNVMVGIDIARDSCTSSLLMPVNSRTLREENSSGFGEKGPHDEDRLTAGVSQDRPTDDASENDNRDQGLVNLGSSKCGAMEWPTISGSSQGSKFPGLERCAGLKGNGGETSTGHEDILKTCSCSFCSTAAYMWSDLHCQDIKGRLSAVKKSQKEAGTLVKKISGAKDNAIQGQGNSTELSNLELSLIDQWRSLFAQMENTLAQESSQLESSFEKLKDLRESCKNDLEMIHKKRLGNS